MTTNHARSCLLSAAMALLSAACFSSSTTGSTGGGSTSGNSASGSGSGSGSGGGAACQPAILMGALFDGQGWQMAAVDPATGAVTQQSSLPAVAGILQSGSAYDPATKHLYMLADDIAFQRKLLTIDGPTGATLATVDVADFTATNPEVVSGGAIVVLHQPGGTWKTATLDAALGTVTSLSASITQDGFTVSRGFDPRTNLLYELGSRDGTSRVLTINGATGTLLLDIPMADFNFDSAIVNGAGQILGMRRVGFGLDWNVAHLDPMTGAITNLAPVSLGAVVSGLSTFDPCTNRVYQVTTDGVLTADGTSGAVISLVPLPGAQSNFANLEAVW
jgi:hypothetical protein